MIIKANAHDNSKNLGIYLLDAGENEHVKILESSLPNESVNFEEVALEFEYMAEQARLLSGSHKFKYPFLHANLNPTLEDCEKMSQADFIKSVDILEKNLDLVGHKRLVVQHIKNGRKHIHVAWSRIDPKTDRLKAFNFTNYKCLEAQKQISQKLNIRYIPIGKYKNFSNLDYAKGGKNVLPSLEAAWRASDDGMSFKNALEQEGFILARGRRGLVVITETGKQMVVSRVLKHARISSSEIRARVDSFLSELPSLEEAKTAEMAVRNAFKNEAVLDSASLKSVLLKRGFSGWDFQKLKDKGFILGLSDKEGRELYTTKEIRLEEYSVLKLAKEIASAPAARVRGQVGLKIKQDRTLTDEQSKAFDHILKGEKIAVIEGVAGAGKSYMLSAAKDALELDGKDVIGTSFTHNVVKDFRGEGFNKCKTLHSLLWSYEKGLNPDYIGKNSVLFVDEAGQLDNKTFGRLLAMTKKTGAQIVLVGDRKQLSSVGRGGLFAKISDQLGHARLSQINRQKNRYEKDAAREFSNYNFKQGLEYLAKNSSLHDVKNLKKAQENLLKLWEERTEQEVDYSRHFVFVNSNKKAFEINESCQKLRLSRGQLGIESFESYDPKTRQKYKIFAGDEVAFKVTDKSKEKRFLNGDRAKFLGFGDQGQAVFDRKGEIFEVENVEGLKIALGYAGTIYAGQGKTVDYSYSLLQKSWKAQGSYVALTRGKLGNDLFKSSWVDAEEEMKKTGFSSSLDFELSAPELEALYPKIEEKPLPESMNNFDQDETPISEDDLTARKLFFTDAYVSYRNSLERGDLPTNEERIALVVAWERLPKQEQNWKQDIQKQRVEDARSALNELGLTHELKTAFERQEQQEQEQGRDQNHRGIDFEIER